MAFVHGKSSYFKLGANDISAFVTKVGFKPSAAASETTTFTKNSKTFIAGLKDCAMQVDFLWDSVVDGYLFAAYGAISTWEYGPAGSTAGLVKYSGSAILTDMGEDSDVGNAVSGSASFQVTGDVTRGTF
jgi:hypothetical protein